MTAASRSFMTLVIALSVLTTTVATAIPDCDGRLPFTSNCGTAVPCLNSAISVTPIPCQGIQITQNPLQWVCIDPDPSCPGGSSYCVEDPATDVCTWSSACLTQTWLIPTSNGYHIGWSCSGNQGPRIANSFENKTTTAPCNDTSCHAM
jgi:hypothetical protein